MRDTLGRNGIDNRGGTLISSINCMSSSEPAGPKEWFNAAWVGTQMVYGQRKNGGSMLSLRLTSTSSGTKCFTASPITPPGWSIRINPAR